MKYGMCMVDIQNIGPPVRVYNTRLHKRMEKEEMTHLEANYQRKTRRQE
jgi:hypothetical protein